MTTANLPRVSAKNEGDAREWSVCAFMGVKRTIHDSKAYDRDSDVVAGDMRVSVKSSAFTLMSGALCNGLDTFDSIWNLYAERVHSNTFAYVTKDYTMYMMTLAEFKQFVYRFCKLERESEKNGGALKIRSPSLTRILHPLSSNTGKTAPRCDGIAPRSTKPEPVTAAQASSVAATMRSGIIV